MALLAPQPRAPSQSHSCQTSCLVGGLAAAERRARSYRVARKAPRRVKPSPTRRVFPTRSRGARRLQPDVLLSHGLARGTSVGRRRRLGPDVHAPVLDPQRPRRRRRRRRRAILLVHKKRWYYACVSPRGGRAPAPRRPSEAPSTRHAVEGAWEASSRPPWTLGGFARKPAR